MIVLNEAKPKYEKLDELFLDVLNDIRFSNQVNVIVDVKEIVKKFFRPDLLNEQMDENTTATEMASDIINIISHYRNFFFKRGKYTNFYFLYSFNKCEKLLKEYPEYKEVYYSKYFNNDDRRVSISRKAIRIVQKVANLIPHVYFIESSEFDEFIYAKYIQTSTSKNEVILILSNDEIFYQLVDENTFILNLKGIKSNLITKDNAIKFFTGKDHYAFSSKMIPLILAISGSKKYAFKNIPSVAKIRACNILQKLLEREKLIDSDSISVPIAVSELNVKEKSENLILENFGQIMKNYNFIRGDTVLYGNKLRIASAFSITKPDDISRELKELNSVTFSAYPLQIDMLLRGEKV